MSDTSRRKKVQVQNGVLAALPAVAVLNENFLKSKFMTNMQLFQSRYRKLIHVSFDPYWLTDICNVDKID